MNDLRKVVALTDKVDTLPDSAFATDGLALLEFPQTFIAYRLTDDHEMRLRQLLRDLHKSLAQRDLIFSWCGMKMRHHAEYDGIGRDVQLFAKRSSGVF